MTDWNAEPQITEEEKKKNRGKMTRGIFDFVRNEGGWVVLGLGGLSMLLGGGVNFGSIAMMAVGAMLVAGARAAPDLGNPDQQEQGNNRTTPRRERTRQQSRTQEQGRTSELQFQPADHVGNNEVHLRTALQQSQVRTITQSAEELSLNDPVSAPSTPTRTRDQGELSLSR